MWGRRDRYTDDNPRVAMLREEVRTIRRERAQGTIVMVAAVPIVGWLFNEEIVAPLPILILIGVFLLVAIHQQLCGIRIDALYREIRDQSPHLWQDP